MKFRMVAGAVLAAAMLAGCAGSDNPALSPEEFNAAQGSFEDLLPALQEEAAPFLDLDLDLLREDSCLGSKGDEEHTRTRWFGELSGFPANPQTANNALDALRIPLEADGWALTSERSLPEEVNGMARELYFEKNALGVTVRYERGELVPDTIVMLATTPCIEHPEDHQMLRSPLDPSYGNSHDLYADEDTDGDGD
ncbi:hypothetical protein QNO00_13685 [Arthrobacter sp. zg-Y1219]|uniref:hypothetical protein n=1 Tax=Arthrobacter sp. zg-Y1219 TaxID=3049067 RepID=UPI0024C3AD4C|nr:hypothetical protein [Arthrobacter sp. zg-Y1219]MDK1361311.1 hypothetical protein [Arthrobacter sp. zg-Y1219]